MTFKSLGLTEELLKAVKEKGYTTPSPIQGKAIPIILDRKDVLASAQTGTGKTAGFTLPILQIITETKNPKYRPIKALILTPTRELAAQIYDNVRDYSKYLNIKSTAIFGGVKPKSQIATLKGGIDILVATPGRLIDLHNQKALSLKRVDILILDEADRMLDMGFIRDIKKVINFLPKKRQNLLFSATFSKEIKELAKSILKAPVLIEAAPENTAAEMVIQKIYRVPKSKKAAMVSQLISEGNWNQVLIFTRTKHGANKLTEKLLKKNISAAAIHGNKSQGARTKALKGFKENSIRVLVATDIAARGLDIPLLPHVINYELPNIAEDYVHRIGRTGRAGASGEAISLVSDEELEYAKNIEKLLGKKLDISKLKNFDINELETKKIPKEKSFKAKKHNNSKSNSSPKRATKSTTKPTKKSRQEDTPFPKRKKSNSSKKKWNNSNKHTKNFKKNNPNSTY
ncbi:ATP-dependent RNA helicase [Tenacibaculum maritimum]|uniref:DEAD/DEAH box helicase n=1 Tax=Tenacibaculum maritimum TaxID=107401 RepID=UPI0012E49370|nr:DEAD/DEAH box helicase [Tenacibaculum maritimum]CAA0171069.1 ATP-dependent RNA helicase [Tenacibaculum maritimum]CAA0173070.1 ATP-dependent RNA helicase [Tenacibaculum maritimum]CAA0177542.1 ATP-dependent RNA helicase [Tenacibaculum maritimum]CAA0211587.1 ATP-dependent RNA helicase [Tenacibaculum maritimum]CAA0216263.1 ATP-dependent RNA helicase [Tenacibaculum maritimum]